MDGVETTAETMAPRGRRILVVEDDEVNRELLSRYLTKRGFDVVAAGDGGAALRAIESDAENIDLVLLDWMMPELSGIEVLRHIRKTSRVPVVMVTSVASPENVVEALGSGADDYVTKPYDLSVLVARIEVRLRSAQSLTPAASTPETRVDAFAQRYELFEKVGEGSFGVVYRARHKDLNCDVAVKILKHAGSPHPDVQQDAAAATAGLEQHVEELRLEGERACRVQHASAVRVFDFGTLADGRPYITMELLRGPTLAQEVKKRGPFTPARAAAVLAPVAECLIAAHAQHVVHRDIKLANIVLHSSAAIETVKVLDFGIAKLLDDGAATTRDGIAGSPSYMAPERLCGLRYDGRADVYSLGVCLYELITGLAPFRSPTGDAMAIGIMHLRKRAIPPSRIVDVPPLVDDVVSQLLEKDPFHRPSASGALTLLKRLM